MKREVPVENAIGMVLAHDLTRIVPGEFKGRAFAKGHIIREEDIPLLLDIGKRHIYVLELDPDEYHEDDAARLMGEALAGPGVHFGEIHEGKAVFKANTSGLLLVDDARVLEMNLIEGISVTTRLANAHVEAGTSIGAVRPIPLTIAKSKVQHVMELASDGPVIQVQPYQTQRIALVTTGSEIQSGRITDKFGPKLREKFARFGFEIHSQVFPGDDQPVIEEAIRDACRTGATLVCVTGGMSVDPDDRSPSAIRNVATEVVSYGTPMLPGSMLMLAYRESTAILGLPGAVMHDPKTSFDVLLPRILAGIRLTKRDLAVTGVGGWLNA